MSIEVNKAIVQRFFHELATEGKLELTEDLVHPNFVRHQRRMGQALEHHGQDYIRQAVDRLHGAWGGFYEKVEQIVAEGDMVAFRVSMGGLHQGEFRGVPPAGSVRNGTRTES